MAFRFEYLSMLVVEDTAPMNELICSVLETLGVGQVARASDGARGFEVFQRETPDIVITDWHMEPVGGLGLVNDIRRNPVSRSRMTPVILLTGYSAISRIYEARDCGITEYLIKPFTAEALARRIANVITNPRDFIDNSPDFFGPDRRRLIKREYMGPLRRREDARQKNICI